MQENITVDFSGGLTRDGTLLLPITSPGKEQGLLAEEAASIFGLTDIKTGRVQTHREWDHGRIASDFEDKFFGVDRKLIEKIPLEEIILLYVAVTRTRHRLDFPGRLRTIFGDEITNIQKWTAPRTLTVENTFERTGTW